MLIALNCIIFLKICTKISNFKFIPYFNIYILQLFFSKYEKKIFSPEPSCNQVNLMRKAKYWVWLSVIYPDSTTISYPWLCPLDPTPNAEDEHVSFGWKWERGQDRSKQNSSRQIEQFRFYSFEFSTMENIENLEGFLCIAESNVKMCPIGNIQGF